MTDNAGVKRYVLVAAVSASFLTPFMGSSVNVAIPTMGRDLGLGPVAVNWVVTAYLLASAVFLLPFGRAADLYGRKRLFVLGLAVFTATSLACGLAGSAGWLIAARVAQGAGSALIFGTGIAILTSVFPPGERGRALGITVAAVYCGLSLGPPIGGFLTEHLGWRSLFHANFVMGLLVTGVAISRLKGEWKDERARRYDLAGAILYGTGLAGLLYGVASIDTFQGSGWMTAAGAGLLVGFVVREFRCTEPLLDLKLFRNPVFAFSNAAALIHYSATFAVGLLLSWYLQGVKGMSAESAGLVLLSQPVMMALVSPMAGRLSDRFEPRLIASSGMGLTFAGLGLLGMIGPSTPTGTVVILLALLGLGFGLFSSPNTNAIMSSVDRSWYGVASAAVGTMRLVGQATSMALLTFFFALYVKSPTVAAASPADLVKSVRVSFAVFAILCAVGVAFSLARGHMRKMGEE